MAEFLTAVANTNVYTFAVAPVFTLMEVCFRERLEGLAWLSVYLHTRAWVCVRVCVCVCVCVCGVQLTMCPCYHLAFRTSSA